MKRMLIVVRTSYYGRQFIDTLLHELHNLATAIAYYRADNLRGEVPAHRSGDPAMALSDMICHLGCCCESQNNKGV